MASIKTELDRNLPVSSLLVMLNPMLDDNKEKFVNIFKTYTVANDIKNDQFLFSYYTVVENDWLEYISSEFYGTPRLWWVIAVFNNIENPYEDLTENTVLKILKYEHLYIIFDNMATIGRL